MIFSTISDVTKCFSVTEKLKRSMSRKKCDLQFLEKLVPAIGWLRRYTASDLPGDIIAGINIGALHIPLGMACALLTGLPAVNGIYMGFFPVSSRQ